MATVGCLAAVVAAAVRAVPMLAAVGNLARAVVVLPVVQRFTVGKENVNVQIRSS